MLIPRLDWELRLDVEESGCFRDNRNRRLEHRGNRNRAGRSCRARSVKRGFVCSFIVPGAIACVIAIGRLIVRSLVCVLNRFSRLI